MINSVRGRAAVGTFEHYHPLFKRGETSSAVFQQPKEEKPNTARPITPQCSLPFSNLQAVQTYRAIVGIVTVLPIVIPVEIKVAR